jgi:phosphatidylglycerophosphate synthase
MHKAGSKPDWETIKPGQRNIWQKWAAQSNGIATPGNTISVGGALIVLIGLFILSMDNILASIALISIGRAADVIDGYVADKTGTKSPLGEAVDVSTDKIIGFVTLVVLLLIYLMPVVFIVIVGIQNIINTLIGLAARFQRIHIHPTREGKLAVAATWGSLVFYLLYQAIEADSYNLSRIALALSLFLFGLFLYYGALSTYTYLTQLKLTVK